MSWVINMTPPLVSLSCLIFISVSSQACSSRPGVGSSAIISFAPLSIAVAIKTLRAIPPESSNGYLSPVLGGKFNLRKASSCIFFLFFLSRITLCTCFPVFMSGSNAFTDCGMSDISFPRSSSCSVDVNGVPSNKMVPLI